MIIRVDDFPGTKPNEFYRHNLENFKMFDDVMREYGRNYVLGVIPKYTTDRDLEWLGSRDNIEIALHGINHDERHMNEFQDYMTWKDIYGLIIDAKSRFESFTEYSVDTYIPPHNVIDRKTVDALCAAGFSEIMCGPETERSVVYYARKHGIKAELFLPPIQYGRSDELIERGAVDFFKNGGGDYLGLHWTWEHNIGLHNLSKFLEKIR